jgi:hypothetical protein
MVKPQKKADKNKVYPRKINLLYKFIDLEGKSIPKSTEPEEKDENGKVTKEAVVIPFLLKDVIIEGLTAVDPPGSQGAKPIDASEKMKRWNLTKKVYDSDTIELTSEEITLVKEQINKRYPSPLIVGQSIEQLDPPAAEKE